jgi:tetratricopeptide (TPR) repeat protein
LAHAEKLCREALAIFKDVNREPAMISTCLSDLGAIEKGQNRLNEAAVHFEEACAIEERLGCKEKSAALSLESGRLLMITGEYSKAIPLLESAIRWHGELDDKNGLCLSLTILAMTLHNNNDPMAAHERAEAARALGLKLSDDDLFQTGSRKKRRKS